MIDETPKTSAPASPRARVDTQKLSLRAQQTWRWLWGSIGVLATIGGVLGLYQFLESSRGTDLPAATQQLLLGMVDEGVLSVDQAERLVSLLSGTAEGATPQATEELVEAVKEGDYETLRAMALMYDEDTRREGLAALEANAETSEDWLRIAELAYIKEPEIAAEAASKSIALDPENFRAVTLLVQIYAIQGDYQKATRSAATAEMMARTPTELLEATLASLNVAMAGRNPEQIEAKSQAMSEALEGYKPIYEKAVVPKSLTVNEIDTHPFWVWAVSHQVLASANAHLKNYSASHEQLDIAITNFEKILPAVPDDYTATTLKRISGVYGDKARTYHRAEDFDAAVKANARSIKVKEDLAASGNKAAIEFLPVDYVGHGQLLTSLERYEEGIEFYKKALDFSEEQLALKPEDKNLKDAVPLLRLQWIMAKRSKGQSEAYKDSALEFLQNQQDEIISDPEDFANYRSYLSTVNAIARLETTVPDPDSEFAFSVIRQAISFKSDLVKKFGASPNSKHLETSLWTALGTLHLNQKNTGEAQSAFEQALQSTEDLPDIDNVKAHSMRLYVLHNLSDLKTDASLGYAQQGLTLAKKLDAASNLETRDQGYLDGFKTHIEELEKL